MGRTRPFRKRLLPFIPVYTKYIKHFANVEEIEVSSKTDERPKKRRKINSYEKEITQDRWLLLPQDVWFSIFQQFEVQTLVKLQEISKGFKNLENEFQRKYKQVCIEKYKLSSSLQESIGSWFHYHTTLIKTLKMASENIFKGVEPPKIIQYLFAEQVIQRDEPNFHSESWKATIYNKFLKAQTHDYPFDEIFHVRNCRDFEKKSEYFLDRAPQKHLLFATEPNQPRSFYYELGSIFSSRSELNFPFMVASSEKASGKYETYWYEKERLFYLFDISNYVNQKLSTEIFETCPIINKEREVVAKNIFHFFWNPKRPIVRKWFESHEIPIPKK